MTQVSPRTVRARKCTDCNAPAYDSTLPACPVCGLPNPDYEAPPDDESAFRSTITANDQSAELGTPEEAAAPAREAVSKARGILRTLDGESDPLRIKTRPNRITAELSNIVLKTKTVGSGDDREEVPYVVLTLTIDLENETKAAETAANLIRWYHRRVRVELPFEMQRQLTLWDILPDTDEE